MATGDSFASTRLLALHLVHWFVASLAGAVLLAGWSWVMPQGFPILHARTAANLTIPLAGVLACLATCAACIAKSRLSLAFSSCLPGLGLGLALGCAVLFPQSMFTLKVLLLTVPLLYLVGTYAVFWLFAARPWFPLICASGFFLAGASWAFTQRAPTPSTQPWNGDLPPAANEAPFEETELLENGKRIAASAAVPCVR